MLPHEKTFWHVLYADLILKFILKSLCSPIQIVKLSSISMCLDNYVIIKNRRKEDHGRKQVSNWFIQSIPGNCSHVVHFALQQNGKSNQ